MKLSENIKRSILAAQRSEITEHTIYDLLSRWVKKEKDRQLLKKISQKELVHYVYWKNLTRKDVKPYYFKTRLYVFLAKFLGLNFGMQLMERSGKHSDKFYKELQSLGLKDVASLIDNEKKDEQEVLAYVDKGELLYTSSIILGLNDALVELTGALAGFTLALQNAKVVALAGFITGVAASFSMAASGYLSTKEEGQKDPVKSSIYTGVTYLVTVLFLITPFFLLSNPFISLAITMSVAITLIMLFNFYIAVAKNLSFQKRAGEMILISLGVAALNFFIGFLAKKFLAIGV